MEEQQGTTSPNRTAQSNGFDEEWDPSLDVNLLKLDFDKMPPTQLLNENSASLVQSHIQEVANVGINHSSETEVQPANSNAQVEAHDTANIWTEGEGGSAESDAKVPKDLEEFHCFPRLPIELRCIIWRATFRRAYEYDSWNLLSVYCCLDKVQNFPEPPIALSINHESRTEALNRYGRIEPRFRCRQCNKSRPVIFFDCKRDTILVSAGFIKKCYLNKLWEMLFTCQGAAVLAQVEHLKVEQINFEIPQASEFGESDFPFFKFLKSLIFVEAYIRYKTFQRGTAKEFVEWHRKMFQDLAAEDPNCLVPLVSIDTTPKEKLR